MQDKVWTSVAKGTVSLCSVTAVVLYTWKLWWLKIRFCWKRHFWIEKSRPFHYLVLNNGSSKCCLFGDKKVAAYREYVMWYITKRTRLSESDHIGTAICPIFLQALTSLSLLEIVSDLVCQMPSIFFHY